MRIPTISGLIKRRLLVNFRADPLVVQRMLPSPFRLQLHNGYAMVGVCLIRLEQIRPSGLPGFLGISSENAAHRISVGWTDGKGQEKQGVFIPRRDSGSFINYMAGGRLFPGEHHAARFKVLDDGTMIDFEMESVDRTLQVKVKGTEAAALPIDSCFASLEQSSQFFEGGSLGYSVTREASRLDGLRLSTSGWQVKPLQVTAVLSSFFEDKDRFPKGSVEFDHALIMRNISHEWHQAEDVFTDGLQEASRTHGAINR